MPLWRIGLHDNVETGMVIDVNLDPTLGAEKGKLQPCIIVTNDIYNQRVPVIQVVPITARNAKKGCIVTNVIVEPTADNGLSEKSVADCLQTRPIDHRQRLARIRGHVSPNTLAAIERALQIVFALPTAQ